MTSPKLRSAGAGDAGGIAECVRAAYSPYIERSGYVEVDRRTERGFPRVYMRKRLWPSRRRRHGSSRVDR